MPKYVILVGIIIQKYINIEGKWFITYFLLMIKNLFKKVKYLDKSIIIFFLINGVSNKQYN